MAIIKDLDEYLNDLETIIAEERKNTTDTGDDMAKNYPGETGRSNNINDYEL